MFPTPEPTEEHRKTLLSTVSKKQMLAILWKCEGGMTYQEIADDLEVSIFTVKNWFRKGTVVYGLHKSYSSEIATEIGKEGLHRLKINADKASQTLEDLMGKDMAPAIRLRVATYILDKTIPMTLKDNEDAETMFYRFTKVCKEIGIKPEDWKGEKYEETQNKFTDYMDEVDRINQFS